MLSSRCYSRGHPPSFPPGILAATDQTHFNLTLTFLSPPFSSHSLSKTSSRHSKPLTRFSKRNSQPIPQSAIERIAEKLRGLGYAEDEEPESDGDPGSEPEPDPLPEPGKIFIPLPKQLPKTRVGHTIDTSWSTPENPVPEPGSSSYILGYNRLRWKVKELKRKLRRKGQTEGEENAPTLAELRLSEEELRRLREIGIKVRKKLKIGKAGITEGIVNGIHERWRTAEVVRLTCEDLCRRNMKRTHDLLERKTGGLVVWRSGSNIILYRGADYKYPYFLADDIRPPDPNVHLDPDGHHEEESCSAGMNGDKSSQQSPNEVRHMGLIQGVGHPSRVRFQLPGEIELFEKASQLLDGLGPRFSDWWGYEPIPVDADLLPAVLPGYRKPFRLLPYGVKPKLTNDEMTTLRRLSHPLPCHFALGRNRNHQGLAAAIVKLWEKCEIAKIAVKRGVQNTNSEIMAEELRHLTGGTLLSRNPEFIVLYRGKDFLPPAVSSAIEERRKSGDEDHETYEQQSSDLVEQMKLMSIEKALRNTSNKLSLAMEEKAKTEKLLEELEKSQKPDEPDPDKEGITEEERYMMRKVGLRMKQFLPMGRRGVFDGTVENMHLHWKYRELVKLICKEGDIEAAHQVARILETESGGILVAVERVNKGYAIILYRGKNYERPACIRPRTLLSRREAMKRSIEAQRSKSLKLHVLKLSEDIDRLKLQMDRDTYRYGLQSLDGSSPQQVGDSHGDDSTPVNPAGRDDDSMGSPFPAERNQLTNISVVCEPEESGALSSELSSEPVADDPELIDAVTRHVEGRILNFHSSDKFKLEESYPIADPDNHLSLKTNLKSSEPSMEMVEDEGEDEDEDEDEDEHEHEDEDETDPEVGSPAILSRSQGLSNRERLILRKQALSVRKRPVLAVGRSNLVGGLVRAIETHFQKHPLAIVNIKGRAKGTSPREMAFKLEQATGALLVSLEPNKVILYRGWGAEDLLAQGDSKAKSSTNASGESAEERRPAVSPELIAAIKLECGLLTDGQNEAIL